MTDFSDFEIKLAPSDSQYKYIKDGWFQETELDGFLQGTKSCLKVEEVILNGKSDFQDIIVFRSADYGMVFALDGIIQLTERDEFAYQEMITQIPMFATKNEPKKVLIIGGGDGGVLREVCKHKSVEKVEMCEIDEKVCEIGKKYFKTVSSSFNDPRVSLFYEDAAKYVLREGVGKDYDCIICDSSDPVGPNCSLFTPEFYDSLAKSLAPGGVICTQGECMWLHLDFISDVMERLNLAFPSINYAYTCIPTYPSGQIGLLVSTKDTTIDVKVPRRKPPSDMPLKYYNSEIHSASFVLPNFAVEKLQPKTTLRRQ